MGYGMPTDYGIRSQVTSASASSNCSGTGNPTRESHQAAPASHPGTSEKNCKTNGGEYRYDYEASVLQWGVLGNVVAGFRSPSVRLLHESLVG